MLEPRGVVVTWVVEFSQVAKQVPRKCFAQKLKRCRKAIVPFGELVMFMQCCSRKEHQKFPVATESS